MYVHLFPEAVAGGKNLLVVDSVCAIIFEYFEIEISKYYCTHCQPLTNSCPPPQPREKDEIVDLIEAVLFLIF